MDMILNSLQVRDPRDRALSEKSVWNKSIYKSVNSWMLITEQLQLLKEKHPEFRVLEIKYENLLSEMNVPIGKPWVHPFVPTQSIAFRKKLLEKVCWNFTIRA